MLDKEKKQQELNRLYHLLYESDKKFEKAKGKRTAITVTIFAIGYFVLFAIIGGKTDIKSILTADIETIGVISIISIVLAWIHFIVNATIFGQLSEMGRRENEAIESIKKEIRELEKSNYY